MKKWPGAFSCEHVAAFNATCGILCEWVNRVMYEGTGRSWLHPDAGLIEAVQPKHMSELASFVRPPVMVAAVVGNVHLVLGEDPSWAKAKQQLRKPTEFIERLRYLNQDSVDQDKLDALQYSFDHCPESFDPDGVAHVNKTTGILCAWVNDVAKRAGWERPPVMQKGIDFLRRSRQKYVAGQKLEEEEVLRKKRNMRQNMLNEGCRPVDLNSPGASPTPSRIGGLSSPRTTNDRRTGPEPIVNRPKWGFRAEEGKKEKRLPTTTARNSSPTGSLRTPGRSASAAPAAGSRPASGRHAGGMTAMEKAGRTEAASREGTRSGSPSGASGSESPPSSPRSLSPGGPGKNQQQAPPERGQRPPSPGRSRPQESFGASGPPRKLPQKQAAA